MKKETTFEERLRKKSIYVADFETRTSKWNTEKTEVWLSYAEHLFEDKGQLNISIRGFFNWIDTLKQPTTIYFHNLNFDGEFILNYLCDISNYLKPNKEKNKQIKMEKNTFTNMSDGVSSHYELKYCNLLGNIIRFQDSYKLLVSSVSSLQGVEEKDKINYDWLGNYKDVSEVSEEHKEYIFSDVRTVKKNLQHFLIRLEKTKALTAAGSALKNLKDSIGVWNFNNYFKNKIKPGVLKDNKELIPGEWNYFRNYYVGGYCLNNPNYEGKIVRCNQEEQIMVLDFNSLYPSVMKFEELPYGFPIYSCKNECEHKLNLLEIRLTARIKPGRIPFIPEKANHANIRWLSVVNNFTCYFTNDFWEEVKKAYEIDFFKIDKKICFESKKGMFSDFIDTWMERKVEAKKQGDKAEYLLDKTIPNSSYGKFGMDYLRKQMFLRNLKENEKVNKGTTLYGSKGQYIWDFEFTTSEPEYIPMAIWITSHAKLWTVRAIETVQKYGGTFLYSDTDSIHYKIEKKMWEILKTKLNIDSSKVGYLDLEGVYKYHICWGRKRYIEFDKLWSTKRNKAFAGVNMNMLKEYKNKDFPAGKVKFKKLIPKKITGGIILEEKEVKIINYEYKEDNL